MSRLAISAEFRLFMRDVVAKIDWLDDRALLVGPEALVHECGRGGLLANSERFRFVYIARDGHGLWSVELVENQVRDIASGRLDEVEARQLDPTRGGHGESLLVWGPYDDDALRARSPVELSIALEALRAIGFIEPLLARLWSTTDEQLLCALNGDDCALYVVAGYDYGTSMGDPTRTGTFELAGHDVGNLAVPWSHCVPWRVARDAILSFAETGTLGEHVGLDGSLPTNLLVLGDFDRETALAARRRPTTDAACSSLPRKSPYGGWADRLLGSLVDLQLAELDTSIREAIVANTAILLIQYGDEALDSVESAHQLARELGRQRGVTVLSATGGDLQIALRRTQDPPTSPHQVPFT
jgi:hypothetical protein